jgi:hypothetical protein
LSAARRARPKEESMASSGATPAAPSIALRPYARERDAVSASESVTFPELVWAHYLHQRALHDQGSCTAEEEFRSQLTRFVAENGTIANAYWCTGEASAVALTEEPCERILGFLWRRRPIRDRLMARPTGGPADPADLNDLQQQVLAANAQIRAEGLPVGQP